jgi:hypothetical protein
VRGPVGTPAGDRLLEKKPGCVASVLPNAEESPHFARCAAFRKHEARKKDEVNSAFHLLRNVAKGRAQFVELLGGDH